MVVTKPDVGPVNEEIREEGDVSRGSPQPPSQVHAAPPAWGQPGPLGSSLGRWYHAPASLPGLPAQANLLPAPPPNYVHTNGRSRPISRGYGTYSPSQISMDI